MHPKTLFTGIIAAGVLLAGCTTNVPQIQHHPEEYQPMLQSMQHWNEISAQLSKQKFGKDVKTVFVKVKVAEGATMSQYEEALQSLVTQRIVASGHAVVGSAPEADVTLLIHTQVISVKDHHFQNESSMLLYPLGAILGDAIARHNGSGWGAWAGVGYGLGAAAIIDAIDLGKFGGGDENPTSVFSSLGYGVKNIFTGDSVGDGKKTSHEVMATAELIQSGKIISGSVAFAYFPSNASSQYYQQHPVVLRSIQE